MPFLNDNEKLSRVRLVPTSPEARGSVDGEFWYDAASGTLKMNQAGTIVQVAPSSAGSGGLLTAVVDIGPHSNTGLGDQTKGILDWNASPIKIVALSDVTKFVNVVSWSFQYSPGVSGYVDPDASQFPSLFINTGLLFGAFTGIADFGLDGLDKKVYPSLPFAAPHPFLAQTGAQLSGNYANVNAVNVAGQPLMFGGFGDNELTTGDGTVRITVHYTIDDILT